MGNSPLVDYIKISPNKTSPRKHKIDTITIHCVVGQLSIESIGNMFAAPNFKASSNYGIGPDGRIGMYVEEKDRSWCSSSNSNDNRAITIEVASDTSHPYAITESAYKGLIKLLTDICTRNGIRELKWAADKSLIGQVDKQNLTVHRWFANKACPGDYIYERLGQIASEVNSNLNKKEESPIFVRVNIDYLNIRTGAGTDHPLTGKYTGKGIFTITEIRSGKGSSAGWGRLKSGAGWISLDYAIIV